jgi:probable rRNA maturation factor
MKPLAVDIIVEDGRWRVVKQLKGQARRAAREAVALSGATVRPGAALAILLTDDARIAELNQRWRGNAKPTNVLSFPSVAPKVLSTSPVLGDIALAFETCRREAEEAGKALGDHLVHLVAHGALHLLGFDHGGRREAERMEDLERRILARLGLPDPYREAAEAGS